MKLAKAGIGVFSVMLITCIVQAAEDNSLRSSASGLEIAPEISYIKYKEPGIMEEKGVMYGINAAYERHQDNRFMFKVDGRFSFGEVDYSSNNTGSMDNIDDYIFESRLCIGYDYDISENSLLTPYLGLGYRYLNDDSSGMTTSTGHLGYERESNYLYSPIGVDFNTSLENGWSMGATAEFDIFWHGWQKSDLGSAISGLNDVENDQKEGYGLRGSVRFQKIGEKFDFIAEPFIRYWNIKKSDDADVTYQGVIIGRGYEPKNNSTEFGAKLGMKF